MKKYKIRKDETGGWRVYLRLPPEPLWNGATPYSHYTCISSSLPSQQAAMKIIDHRERWRDLYDGEED